MRYGIFIVGIVAVLLVLPAVIAACPKCMASTSKPVLDAYYLSVAFMSLLPLGMIGSIVAWARYRIRRAQRDD